MSRFCVILPIMGSAEAIKETFKSLVGQSLTDWEAFVIGKDAAAVAGAAGDKRVQAGPEGLDSLAKMINWATQSGKGELVTVVPEGIILSADALEVFSQTFKKNPKAAGAYASYTEVKADGKAQEIVLYPHEGAYHERFDFGFLKVYRTDLIKEIGGFRTDLVHAAEYDADLKLGDKYTLELAEKPLYTVKIPAAVTEGAAIGGLHSPGKGKLGGFSYVFYPADLEKEITGVFEEMLHRRNAWIDHETVPVQYPKEGYEILASVVIPVLNRAAFIGNAIDRILEGTYQKFEVIIIDNGSTDGTLDVVKKYVEKDPRIRLIHGKGNCIASALNEGIKAARGKYICQLDSDDEYTPDTLEKMVGHIETHPKCGLAISYYELMDENRGKVEGIEPVTHKGYTRNQILRRDGGGALRVFPKVVLEEMGYYDEKNYGNFGEDYDMVLKTGEKYDVDRVHHVLYRYRRHSDNTDITRDPIMKIRNKNNARQDALKRRQAINKKLGKA